MIDVTVMLKPCPFCGGEAKYENGGEWQYYDAWSVQCQNCGALRQGDTDMRKAGANTEAEAIAAWNQRADAQGEAVAWAYDCIRPVGDRKHLDPPFTVRKRCNMDPRYWRETPLYTHPPAQDVEALVEENKRLQQALVDHNDQLRSAHSVASRDGAETNWLTFRGAVTYTLAEHHETVVAAREALTSFRSKP